MTKSPGGNFDEFEVSARAFSWPKLLFNATSMNICSLRFESPTDQGVQVAGLLIADLHHHPTRFYTICKAWHNAMGVFLWFTDTSVNPLWVKSSDRNFPFLLNWLERMHILSDKGRLFVLR